MIKRYPAAKRSHGYLILPDANGRPQALQTLFGNPKELMAAMIRGGWIVPRRPKRSLFLTSIIGTPPNRGPMEGRLAPEDVQLLTEWIAKGAPMPDDGA
jgi:hypothetical protein